MDSYRIERWPNPSSYLLSREASLCNLAEYSATVATCAPSEIPNQSLKRSNGDTDHWISPIAINPSRSCTREAWVADLDVRPCKPFPIAFAHRYIGSSPRGVALFTHIFSLLRSFHYSILSSQVCLQSRAFER